MRLFQNLEVYPAYLASLHTRRFADQSAFIAALINDRYFAIHLLQPVLAGDDSAFLAVGSDAISQQLWARAHGLPRQASRHDILLAQIEEHRTEIFYNVDPVRFPSEFVRRLPGCVRHSVAWRAAPHKGADMGAYDVVVSNFPSIRRSYDALGWRTAEFYPAIDPVMNEYSRPYDDRETDVLFIGTYSRHHAERARALRNVAALQDRLRVKIRLVESRFTRLANTPLGLVGPLAKYRYPGLIRSVAQPPVFGRDLYHDLGNAKVVFNGAIDMSGEDRGNMRCFETMGCGALLFTDRGNYPFGMVADETMACYHDIETVATDLERMFDSERTMKLIASNGQDAANRIYSKSKNWASFQELVAAL